MPRARSWRSTICLRSTGQSGIMLSLARIIARMAHRITLIPGDGIGPEVAEATVRAVEATGVSIAWESVELTSKAIEVADFQLPQPVLDSLGRTRTGLKGPP